MPTNTVSLSAPYPLFALSQPTAPTDTNNNSKKKNIPTIRPISTAAVVAAPLGAKQRKRKRTEGEVVAGVDGEGVNIYNAATTQIVSAYALPPATKFSAAPVSLRTNAGRKTYAAVSAPQPRIVGWVEEGEDAVTLGPGYERVLKKTKVAFIELVSAHEGFEVVAVEEKGVISGLSEDLKEERWRFESGWENGKAVYVESTTLAAVKTGILADRTGLDFAATKDEDPVLLVLYQTAKGPYHLDVVLLMSSTAGSKAHRVLRLNFPAVATTGPVSFALELSTGKLHLADNTTLSTFSLLSPIPTLTSELKLSATASRHTLLQLSPTSLLISGPDDILLYDTLYSSVQARTPTDQVLVLTTFLPDLALAIGYTANGLSALQLSRPGSALTLSKEGRLIDSLCRGIVDIDLPPRFPADIAADLSHKRSVLRQDFATEKEEKRQRKLKHLPDTLETDAKPLRVDDLSTYLYDSLLPTIAKEETLTKQVLEKLEKAKNRGSVQKYEATLAKYCGIKLHPYEQEAYQTWKESQKKKEKKAAAAKATSNEPTDSDVAMDSDSDSPPPPLPSWLHPIAYKNNHDLYKLDVAPRKDLHNLHKSPYPTLPWSLLHGVLSQMFTLNEEDRLEFDFYSFNILEFLVGAGVFRPSLLASVKRSLGGGPLQPGEIVDALLKEDPSLDLLDWFFSFADDIPAEAVVRAIRIVLEGVQTPSSVLPVEDVPMLEADKAATSPETQLQLETAAAERELEQTELEMKRMANRESIIDAALRRLNRHPQPLIVAALKSGLSGDLTLSFIRHLQHALGELSEQDDPETPILAISAHDAALVVDILTAALDAVGLTGLILSNEPAAPENTDGEDPQLLIASLHEQVSLSVQSLEESSAVARLLEEMLRHAALVQPKAILAPKRRVNPVKNSKKERKAAAEAQKTPATPAVPDTPTAQLAATPTPTTTAAALPEQIISSVKIPTLFTKKSRKSHGKTARARERKLQQLGSLSLAKRLELATKKRPEVRRQAGMVVPETVLAVRRAVGLLPIWSGADKKMGPLAQGKGPLARGAKKGHLAVGGAKGEELGLGLGNVLGGGRYVVERVDV